MLVHTLSSCRQMCVFFFFFLDMLVFFLASLIIYARLPFLRDSPGSLVPDFCF